MFRPIPPLVVGAACVTAASIASVRAGAEPLTLGDAIELAVRNNPDTNRAERAVALSDDEQLQSYADLAPRLSASSSLGRTIGRSFSQQEGGLIFGTTDVASGGLDATLELFGGFESTAGILGASERARAAQRWRARVRDDVTFRVIQQYVLVLQNETLLQVREQQLAAQRELLSLVQRLVDVGRQPPSDFFQQQASYAEAKVALGRRETDTHALARRIRAAVEGQIPGAEIEVKPQSGLWILRRLFRASGGDEDIELQIRGHDLTQADAFAARARAALERVPGVVGARLERREGQPERNLRFDRAKIYALGLSVADVTTAVQVGVGGGRAGTFREDGEEYPIVVRLRPEDRLTVEDLDDLSVRTPEGQMVPVSSLVEADDARGPQEIAHIDGQRVTYVTASVREGYALGDVVQDIQGELAALERPDNLAVDFGGAYQEQEKAQRDFLLTVLIALLLVYMVMAAQFERFVDPLIVMVSVPLAFVGVVPTLLLTGTTLNLQSIMGLVMLIGIVVNNAIVLVDYINHKRREEGLAIEEAALEAARLRLRPILMTTATTVLGLAALALGLGTGASLQASLARVVIGGLLASTLLTLVLMPVLYTSAATLSDRVRARRQGRDPTAADDGDDVGGP